MTTRRHSINKLHTDSDSNSTIWRHPWQQNIHFYRNRESSNRLRPVCSAAQAQPTCNIFIVFNRQILYSDNFKLKTKREIIIFCSVLCGTNRINCILLIVERGTMDRISRRPSTHPLSFVHFNHARATRLTQRERETTQLIEQMNCILLVAVYSVGRSAKWIVTWHQ